MKKEDKIKIYNKVITLIKEMSEKIYKDSNYVITKDLTIEKDKFDKNNTTSIQFMDEPKQDTCYCIEIVIKFNNDLGFELSIRYGGVTTVVKFNSHEPKRIDELNNVLYNIKLIYKQAILKNFLKLKV